MMRGAWLALVLALPALSGCLSFLDGDGEPGPVVTPADVGYDPSTIRVTDVVRHNTTIASFDGTPLAVVAYEPKTSDRTPQDETPRWGTVVFLHTWGFFKEEYEGAGGATGAPVPEAPNVSTNFLDRFAREGLLAVAYDARGFGQSGGTSTIAGPAEQQDLQAVLDWAQRTFPTNGRNGVVGQSYGGGQALLAWADNAGIATAVSQYGWVDLYDGLVPGNVPKAQWAVALGGLGGAGTRGRVSPMLADWYQKAVTRTELDGVRAEMDVRSVGGRMGSVTKPLLLCQGMQESLFPQAERAWQEAGGFTRAFVFTGGHGAQDEECWARTLDWFRFFLAGHDTGVAAWPALTTVDVNGGRALDYAAFPQPVPTTFHLREPSLEPDPSDTTFTVQQRALANPFVEPSGLWDQSGMPNSQVPEQLRDDPSAVFFETATFNAAEVVLGAPTLTLQVSGDAPTPFQVVGTLFHVDGNGRSRVLTRGAIAPLAQDDIVDGAVTMRFDWVKADVAPGEKLVLKLGANDPSWFLPLAANYAVTFTGQSALHLPFFEG